MREYNALIKEALNIGIKSPETYYYEGKIKGKASRDRGIMGHKAHDDRETGNVPATHNEDLSKTEEETRLCGLLKKPGFSSFPRLAEKISMIEYPKFLGGFRGFKFFSRK